MLDHQTLDLPLPGSPACQCHHTRQYASSVWSAESTHTTSKEPSLGCSYWREEVTEEPIVFEFYFSTPSKSAHHTVCCLDLFLLATKYSETWQALLSLSCSYSPFLYLKKDFEILYKASSIISRCKAIN